MRPRGPLGATLRRLRGYADPLPAEVDRELLEAIELGRVVPSAAALRTLAGQMGFDLVQRSELEGAYRRTVALHRANPWASANRRAG